MKQEIKLFKKDSSALEELESKYEKPESKNDTTGGSFRERAKKVEEIISKEIAKELKITGTCELKIKVSYSIEVL